jgi:hypothetical protein
MNALGVVVVLAAIALVGWAVIRGVSEAPEVVGSFATALGAVSFRGKASGG